MTVLHMEAQIPLLCSSLAYCCSRRCMLSQCMCFKLGLYRVPPHWPGGSLMCGMMIPLWGVSWRQLLGNEEVVIAHSIYHPITFQLASVF